MIAQSPGFAKGSGIFLKKMKKFLPQPLSKKQNRSIVYLLPGCGNKYNPRLSEYAL
jgi:hypothetical protein